MTLQNWPVLIKTDALRLFDPWRYWSQKILRRHVDYISDLYTHKLSKAIWFRDLLITNKHSWKELVYFDFKKFDQALKDLIAFTLWYCRIIFILR